jgi:hypothetical protein
MEYYRYKYSMCNKRTFPVPVGVGQLRRLIFAWDIYVERDAPACCIQDPV